MKANNPADQSPLKTGEVNLEGERFRLAYPAMMYRKTDDEEHQVQTWTPEGKPQSWLIVNAYGPKKLLCETRVANDGDEAEAMTLDGWDSSPEAAYGMATGVAAATTAKDDEIAALRAELAAAQAVAAAPASEPEPFKRGPGRPRKEPLDADTFAA